METAVEVIEKKQIKIDGLIPVDATQYNVEATTAAGIAAAFVPMLYTMTEMEKEFNAIVVLPIADKDTVKKARELRLRYVKVRGEVDDAHKAGKAKILRDGKLWDAWKNTGISASEGKEEKLKSIEKHAENLEKERLEKLQILRVALLAEYVENASDLMLSSMPDDVFEAYLTTKKQQFEDRKAAELKAEQDRIAREKAEAEEREAQRMENEKLKADAIEKQKEIDRIAKELSDKKAAEAKAEAERIAAEKAAKLEAEKLAKAPIKSQLTAWVNSFQIPQTAIEHEKKTLIIEKFGRFLDWAKSEIETI